MRAYLRVAGPRVKVAPLAHRESRRLSPKRLHALYPEPDLPLATARSLKTFDGLMGELEGVRERGYATNFGESEEEIGSVGVAVHDADGQPRAGLAVSAPLSRLDETTDLTRIVKALQETARDAQAGLA